LDSGIFENVIREVMKMPYVYSLLVVKNGFLINEWYHSPQNKYDSNYIASVSKSILSALIGLALKEKYLASQDERMMDFFPEYVTSNIDPRKFDITLRHLLMLRAGYPYDIDLDIWRSNESWIKFAIELPLEADPGESWAYSSASTHLLSVILAKATGISTLEFAEQYLFEPLNISIRDWKQDPEGYYIGGWGMYFTPRDLARFGYLYLNSGFMDGIQIVPSDWVDKSIKDYSLTNINLGAFRDVTYGYLWYHANVFDYDVYFAQGSGGQCIVIIPELNMLPQQILEQIRVEILIQYFN
jgi:CubicO group peptidase (beta-lactamase class C family)